MDIIIIHDTDAFALKLFLTRDWDQLWNSNSHKTLCPVNNNSTVLRNVQYRDDNSQSESFKCKKKKRTINVLKRRRTRRPAEVWRNTVVGRLPLHKQRGRNKTATSNNIYMYMCIYVRCVHRYLIQSKQILEPLILVRNQWVTTFSLYCWVWLSAQVNKEKWF